MRSSCWTTNAIFLHSPPLRKNWTIIIIISINAWGTTFQFGASYTGFQWGSEQSSNMPPWSTWYCLDMFPCCLITDACHTTYSVWLTLLCFLSVGHGSASVTEPSVQLDLESVTIRGWTSDSQDWHTVRHRRRFYLGCGTTVQCEPL